jgi:hypothetical protein
MNSEEFLSGVSDDLFNRDRIIASNMGRDPRQVQRRELRNARDYFDNVVVPSRQNDRLDDIDFVSNSQVLAFTVNARGDRLILYHLEMINGSWKIAK